MGTFRTVETYKNYFEDFFTQQTTKVKEKIIWTLNLIEDVERVPKTYFEHIDHGIYEIRVKHGSNIYRIFSFFDKGKLIIVANGFQKKTQKTPKSEIDRARKIKAEYEQEKK